jgi:hypothetical protein
MKLRNRLDPFALAAFLVPLSVYLATLAPSVTFFDSGEFAVAASSLGSAHSPGYPTFLNYAKPFTWLPFGSIAFRINIATAVSAAFASLGVYLLASHLLKSETAEEQGRLRVLLGRGVPLAGALAFAFSPRLWLQSNHDKPYPLISFISAMVFLLLLIWRDGVRRGEDRPGYIYAGTFLAGLAFGAHQTMILLVPSFAFLVLSADWRFIFRFREWILGLFFALLGFSVHLHLPFRAARNPLLNWGDPKTWTQFYWHFFRKGYPVEKPERNWALLWEQVNAFNVPHEFTLVGLVLLLIGCVAFARKRRDEILAYLVGLFFFLLVIAGYFNTPFELIFLTEEFFTPLYLFSAVLIALGLFSLVRTGLDALREKRSSVAAAVAAALLVFSLPGALCALNYYENDQHNNYIAFDYAENSLRTLPQQAVLFTWGDSGAFPLWYLQGVERMRDDTAIVHTPHLVFDWYLDGFPDIFAASSLRRIPEEAKTPENALMLSVSEQMERRPVYIDFSTRYSVQFDNFRLAQEGLCYRLLPKNVPLPPPDLSVWDRYALRGLVADDMTFRDLDTGKAILIYGYSHMELGETLLKTGNQASALVEIRKAVAVSPDLRPQAEQTLAGNGLRL